MAHRLIPCCPQTMQALPSWLIGLAAGFQGRWQYMKSSRETKVGRYNISTAMPELSSRQREKMLKRSLKQSARTAIELTQMWGDKGSDISRMIVGHKNLKLLNRAIEYGKGVVIAVPFIGNWEVIPHYLASLDTKVLLSSAAPYPDIEEMILDGRMTTGATLVPDEERSEQRYVDGLKQGAIACIFTDNICLHEPAAVFAPWFSHKAYTSTLIPRIARGTGAVQMFAFAERVKGGYRINWVLGPEEIYDADPIVSATAVNRGVRRCVNKNPEQNWWGYERLMIQKGGKVSPYQQL